MKCFLEDYLEMAVFTARIPPGQHTRSMAWERCHKVGARQGRGKLAPRRGVGVIQDLSLWFYLNSPRVQDHKRPSLAAKPSSRAVSLLLLHRQRCPARGSPSWDLAIVIVSRHSNLLSSQRLQSALPSWPTSSTGNTESQNRYGWKSPPTSGPATPHHHCHH